MMDSARDFDVLGESVQQVRVSARTLALLGFFNFKFMLTPFFLHQYIYIDILSGLAVTICDNRAARR